MTRSLCGRFALLLAGVFGIVSASTAIQGQDPFGTAPDSGNRVESSRDSKSAAKEPERIFRTSKYPSPEGRGFLKGKPHAYQTAG